MRAVLARRAGRRVGGHHPFFEEGHAPVQEQVQKAPGQRRSEARLGRDRRQRDRVRLKLRGCWVSLHSFQVMLPLFERSNRLTTLLVPQQ